MIKVLIAGDFVPRYRITAQIESGDFSCMDEVKSIIQTSDYAIINFESPVVMREANPIPKAGPNFCCSEKALKCIANAGFKCVSLANNHFFDFGNIGVTDTIEACNQFNIDYFGGGKNLNEASRTLYKEIKGKTLAFVNCCEHEFSIATENEGGSNPLDTIQQYYAIQEAKAHSDYLVVIVHGGHELYQLPSPRMVETYRFFVNVGADAVINHHQHCYNGYEVYKGKPIFYGIGNFCFDSSFRNHIWNNGFLVMLEMEDEIGFSLYPYCQCDEYPVVKLLKQNAFDEKISELNNIIANKESLQKEINKYYDSFGQNMSSVLEPVCHKYYMACVRRGILPSLISKKRKLQAENYVCCESLRDVFINYLNNK